jgi:hypothetical protein
MTLSMQEAIRQNTIGYSEGLPLGVPTSYGWYNGVFLTGINAPPSGFNAVTGWGQVYQDSTEPAYTNPNARVEVANSRTYVHLRSTGEWVLVQDQANNPIIGGHFAPDFHGENRHMNVTTRADGTASFAAPTTSYNDHFWTGTRGTYTPGDVDGVYVQMDMRVTDPNLNVIANVGADWWRNPTAPYVDGFSNNPGAGMSNWVDLSTEWRTLAFYAPPAIFQSDPPPPLAGSGGETTPPPVITPPSPTTPEATTPSPTTPSPTTPQPTGDNLLVNGSFEATAVREGAWSASRSIPGWTALSGSSIELWNNHNGVRATDGSNFGELDYLGARDGMYQTVRTEAGQSYALSFDARSRPGFTASTTTIEVLWNDSVVATVPPGSNWSNHSFTVTGTGGDDRLTFREAENQGGDGLGALYDNVRLVASGSSAQAPSPAPAPAPTQPAAGDNLLVNGSFEATPVASNEWRSFDSIEGWRAVSGGTIELWNNLNGVRATDGSNFGELDYLGAQDGLYQTVSTEAGQTYDLSFDARSRPGFGASTTTMEVLWNDQVVASVPPGTDWSTYNFSVTGTGGSDRLTFREAEGQGGDGLGALYDNVRLVAAGSASNAAPASASQTDRSVDLMTQYAASTVTSSNTGSTSVFDQTRGTESLAPTLTNTHQLVG